MAFLSVDWYKIYQTIPIQQDVFEGFRETWDAGGYLIQMAAPFFVLPDWICLKMQGVSVTLKISFGNREKAYRKRRWIKS